MLIAILILAIMALPSKPLGLPRGLTRPRLVRGRLEPQKSLNDLRKAPSVTQSTGIHSRARSTIGWMNRQGRTTRHLSVRGLLRLTMTRCRQEIFMNFSMPNSNCLMAIPRLSSRGTLDCLCTCRQLQCI